MLILSMNFDAGLHTVEKVLFGTYRPMSLALILSLTLQGSLALKKKLNVPTLACNLAVKLAL